MALICTVIKACMFSCFCYLIISVFPMVSSESAVIGEECEKTKFDLLWIIDRSHSISQKDMDLQKNFIVGFAKSFPRNSWSKSLSRCAFVSFTNKANIMHEFTSLQQYRICAQGVTFSELFNTGNQAASHELNTNFKAALRTGIEVLQDARKDVKRILIFITDGKRNLGGSPEDEAIAIRNDGVDIFAVGIKDYSPSELLELTGNPEFIFTVDDFSGLNEHFREKILQELCKTIVSTTNVTNPQKTTPSFIPVPTSVPTTTTTTPTTTTTTPTTTTTTTTPTTTTTTRTTTTPTTTSTTTTTTPTTTTTTTTPTTTTTTTPTTTTTTPTTTTTTTSTTSTSATTPTTTIPKTTTTTTIMPTATFTTATTTEETVTKPPPPVIKCFEKYISDLESQLFARFGYFLVR